MLNKYYDRFSLNFDPVQEILKMRCQISFLMKKVITLKKLRVKMKTFTQPFFNHSSLSINRKKKCGNENHQEDTKHIHALVANLLHNRIGNLDWCLENRLSLLSRGGCNAYFLDENLGARGKHLAIQLLWATAQLLVTRVSLI